MLPKASKQIALVAHLAALIGLVAVNNSHAGDSEFSVVGAVESADCNGRTVKILGVVFAANDAVTAAAVCSTGRRVGLRYVSASGVAGPTGRVLLTRLTSLSTDRYVPGATAVYLSGSVSEIRIGTGDVVLSGAVVSLGGTELKVGSVVEILGTQPVLSGVVLPTAVRIADRSNGPAADLDSSIGSGFNLNSSIGSGSNLNSSIGSGSSLNSSIGSGVSLNSSIGSGSSVSSSIGSGSSLNSSIGSGVSLNSSIGSGFSLNSSIGSGVSLNSSIGSGSSVNSSIGSGVSL
jgi:trimeric autotransporter adhesin